MQDGFSAREISTVLFDLDGTLLDTSEDMGAALNAVLRHHGIQPKPLAQIRARISRGGMALVEFGFGVSRESDEAQEILRELLECYEKSVCVKTDLFAGMEGLLNDVEASGRKWGIVTNKPTFLTAPLLRELDLDKRAEVVVCGDTLPTKKPDPAPLLHACESCGGAPEHTVYIGDDARDVEAGKAAGMFTIAAAYGFILPDDDPDEWGADIVVENARQIQRWLNA